MLLSQHSNGEANSKTETKASKINRLVKDVKDFLKMDITSYLTNPDCIIKSNEIREDVLESHIKGRISTIHFPKFLGIHVACLLKDPKDARNFFSSNKNVEYEIFKKGKDKKQKRKVTIDQYRKKFQTTFFNPEFLKDCIQETRKIIENRKIIEARVANKRHALNDSSDEEEQATLLNASAIGTSVTSVPPLPSNLSNKEDSKVATFNIVLPTTTEASAGKFIEIYASYIYKSQEKFVKKMLGQTSEILHLIESVEDELLLSIQEKVKSLEDSILQMVTTTFVAKVGETRESNSSWQGRKNTFNMSPNHVKYEVINVDSTAKNAKRIEAYIFAFLTYKGYKLPKKFSKSGAGEFFRLFIVSEDGKLENMHSSIAKGHFKIYKIHYHYYNHCYVYL